MLKLTLIAAKLHKIENTPYYEGYEHAHFTLLRERVRRILNKIIKRRTKKYRVSSLRNYQIAFPQQIKASISRYHFIKALRLCSIPFLKRAVNSVKSIDTFDAVARFIAIIKGKCI